MAKLKVGDRLWLVERRNRSDHGSEVVVTKVGRKWTYIADAECGYDRGRIDENMVVDAGAYSSNARCFGSQSEYEHNLMLTRAWDDLRWRVEKSYRRPEHISLADIEAINARLSTPEGER